jgi:tetratricopeptide (TPR) repeat protein
MLWVPAYTAGAVVRFLALSMPRADNSYPGQTVLIMTDTTDSQTNPASGPVRLESGPNVSEAVKASLASLAASRRAESKRRRRGLALKAMTVAFSVSAVWGIATRLRGPRVVAVEQAPVAAVAEQAPVAEVASPSVVTAPAPETVVEAPFAAEPVVATEAPVVEAQATAAQSQHPQAPSACAAAAKSLPWQKAIETCTAAFELKADSATALILAKETYKRGMVKEAGEWAEKALLINDALPEAYVIVAYAAEHDGNKDSAATAYRQYLALAPHGWHANKARQGLRRLR